MTRATGTAARISASTSLIARATSATFVVFGNATFAADEQLVGAEVEGLHVDERLDALAAR